MKQKIRVVFGALALLFVYGIINSTLGYFVSPVSAGLGVGRTAFTFYYSIMAVTGMVMAPVMGRLIQRHGSRWVIACGAIALPACVLMMSLGKSVLIFYAIGFLLGLIQFASTNLAAVIAANKAFANRGGGMVMGLIMSGSGLAGIVMSLILPRFIEQQGWRSAYRLQALLCLALMALGLALLFPYTGKEQGAAQKASAQPESDDGWLYADAIRAPRLYLLMAAILFIVLGTCFINHMPAHFAQNGVSEAAISRIMGIFSLMLTVGKIMLGSLYDKLGRKKTLYLVLGAYAISFLIILSQSTALVWVGSALIAFGMASATVLPPLLTEGAFGRREYSSIWGLVSVATSFGGAVGTPLWGAVYDLTGSYHSGLLAAPVLILLSLFILLSILGQEREKVYKTNSTFEESI